MGDDSMNREPSESERRLRKVLRHSMDLNGDVRHHDSTDDEEGQYMGNVNPEEFGYVRSEVRGLRRDNDRLAGIMERVESRLSSIETKLSEQRGGWKTIATVGGIVTVAAGGAGALLHKAAILGLL